MKEIISFFVTDVVQVESDESKLICCEDKVGLLPVIEFSNIGIFPDGTFQTSTTQLPNLSAIICHPVIIPAYGITKYSLFPVVIVDPDPSIVIPREPDVEPDPVVP